MNSKTFITLKKELRAIIRDKKSLMMMLLTPFMIPVMVIFMAYMDEMLHNDMENSVYPIGLNYQLNEVEKAYINELKLEVKNYGNLEELQQAYINGEVDAYIYRNNDTYTIFSNENDTNSAYAGSYAASYLDSYNNYLGTLYLNHQNINPNLVYNNLIIEYENITGENYMINMSIMMSFIFAIMSITLTAIYSATDITAGEKERGTLETILTFPIKSRELIVGKYLAIVFSAIVTAIIGVVFSIGSLYMVKGMFSIYETVTFNFKVTTILLVFLIMILYSLFISGVAIAIASFSKTYKEAQSSLTPLSLVTMVPMFFCTLGIELSPTLALVPIVNHTMILNDILMGTATTLNILIVLGTSVLYVVLIIFCIVRQYRSEKILFSI